jgi:hypothetical protein
LAPLLALAADLDDLGISIACGHDIGVMRRYMKMRTFTSDQMYMFIYQHLIIMFRPPGSDFASMAGGWVYTWSEGRFNVLVYLMHAADISAEKFDELTEGCWWVFRAACRSGSVNSVLRMLHDAKFAITVDRLRADNNQLLLDACTRGDLGMVQCLMTHGLTIDDVWMCGGNTAADLGGHEDVAAYLLSISNINVPWGEREGEINSEEEN